MPAAAVIPAPIAYTKVVAVKKLVVEFLVVKDGPFLKECVTIHSWPSSGRMCVTFSSRAQEPRHLL